MDRELCRLNQDLMSGSPTGIADGYPPATGSTRGRACRGGRDSVDSAAVRHGRMIKADETRNSEAVTSAWLPLSPDGMLR